MLYINMRRPWIKIGEHVYIPCADPDGHCLKLNPYASRTLMGWATHDFIVQEPGDDDHDLARRLELVNVAALEDAASVGSVGPFPAQGGRA